MIYIHVMLVAGAGLTQQWKQHGVVIGHHEQVDTVEGRAGLQVAKELPQVTVFGTVTHKHLQGDTYGGFISNSKSKNTF